MNYKKFNELINNYEKEKEILFFYEKIFNEKYPKIDNFITQAIVNLNKDFKELELIKDNFKNINYFQTSIFKNTVFFKELKKIFKDYDYEKIDYKDLILLKIEKIEKINKILNNLFIKNKIFQVQPSKIKKDIFSKKELKLIKELQKQYINEIKDKLKEENCKTILPNIKNNKDLNQLSNEKIISNNTTKNLKNVPFFIEEIKKINDNNLKKIDTLILKEKKIKKEYFKGDKLDRKF